MQPTELLSPFRAGAFDPRIDVLDLAGASAAAAIVRVANASACPFVHVMAAGEQLEPTALESALMFLLSFPAAAAVTGQAVVQVSSAPSTLDIAPVLLRASAVSAVGGFSARCADVASCLQDLGQRCAAVGLSVGSIPRVLVWRPRASASISRSRWPNISAGSDVLRRFPTMDGAYQPSTIAVPAGLNVLAHARARLLMLLPWLETGDADVFNLHLLAELVRRGMEMTVVTTVESANPWLARFAQLTSDIFVLPDLLQLSDYAPFVLYLLRSRRSDAVFASNSEWAYHFLPTLRVHFPHMPVLDYHHLVEPGWRAGGHARHAAAVSQLVDVHAVASLDVRDWLVARGVESAKFAVCPAGVDVARFAGNANARVEWRRRHGIGPLDVVVLYSAAVPQLEGIDVFIGAAKLLSNETSPRSTLRFLLAGKVPSTHWAHEELHRSAALTARVSVLGEVPRGDLPALYSASDILLLPSATVTDSLPVLEAMACGLAVVAADVDALRQVLRNTTGVLVSHPANASAEQRAGSFARAILRLAADPAGTRRMGAAARELVASQFSMASTGWCVASALCQAQQRARTRSAGAVSVADAAETMLRGTVLIAGARDASRLWRQNVEMHRNQDCACALPTSNSHADSRVCRGCRCSRRCRRRRIKRCCATRRGRLSGSD